MSPVLPAPLALVYLSGVAETAVGLSLLVPWTRSYAAWATIALSVAIFPANVDMAVSMVTIEGTGGGDPSVLVRWARLPLQGVLLLWRYWYTD
ncbi:DoxX family protein [Haloarcula japonica]|uniref:DoxX family protein n=1 Tax=Haloarcula japonica TaxID=29282 RepID=UPI001EF9D947|nr:DoxX family protein [Haloarcula japonica]